MNANAGELERMLFFEQARDQAEKDFKNNPKNAQALTRWGGALLELASFRQGEEASHMINEAVEKFTKALSIEDSRHDTMWCLGNAYTSQGFLTTNQEEAHHKFAEAKKSFVKALELSPDNEVYKKAVEMTDKAPELYQEIQKSLGAQASAQQKKGPGKPVGVSSWLAGLSDGFWDTAGFTTFIVLAVGMFAMMSLRAAPAPAPAS